MPSRDRRPLQQQSDTSSSVLDAAALQDGLARRMELRLGSQRQARRPGVVVIVGGGSIEETRFASRRRSSRFSTKQPGQQSTIGQGASTAGGPGSKPSTTTATNNAEASRWTCRSCSAVNSAAGNDSDGSNNNHCCSVCMRERFVSDKRAGSSDACSGCEKGERFYPEENRRQPQRRVSVTLAQLRGLEEPPQPTLTVGEWSAVEARAWARGDEAALCPICREAFRGEAQVILSCSHVFHRACLSSFERFLRGQERSCPLCRKTGYQKKLTTQGAVAWRQRCARRLQCAYRSYSARRGYRVLLRSHYAAGLGDPQRRREFLSEQAADRAGRLVTALEDRGDSIDRLFGEFDRGLAFSRSVFGHTPPSPTVEIDAFSSSNDNHGRNILRALNSLVENEPSERQSQDSSPKEPQSKSDEHYDWNEVWQKAVDRGEEDCPICMCRMEPIHFAGEANSRTLLLRALRNGEAPSHEKAHAAEYVTVHKTDGCKQLRWSSFNPRHVSTIPGEGIYLGEGGGSRPILEESANGQENHTRATMGAKCRRQRPACAKAMLLLSCSHVFHKTAFEGLNINEAPLCPLCRQEYDAVDPSGAALTSLF